MTPYPTDHSTLVDRVLKEQAAHIRPAIRGSVALDGNDTDFIHYLIWWDDMPQALYTFFDSYDLSGKTVIPFSAHGGSGFAGTPDTIRDARAQIVDWVSGLDIAQGIVSIYWFCKAAAIKQTFFLLRDKEQVCFFLYFCYFLNFYSTK